MKHFLNNIATKYIASATLLVILCWLVPSLSYALTDLHLSEQQLERARQKFGSDGLQRLKQWQKFIIAGSSLDQRERLEKVNQYINSVPFASDSSHWQQEDYWATPYEFIAGDGGDCEDYAIAKYYTLRAMGVDRKRLRIAYVNMEGKDTPHMVLLYFRKASAEAVVLDNTDTSIQPYRQRDDLEIVYTANEDTVWGITQDGRFKPLGDSSILHKLSDLISRMTKWNEGSGFPYCRY